MKRRNFLKTATAASLTGLYSQLNLAQQAMPTRLIPGTNERLPVIGLGSTKAVRQIPTVGTEPITAVLRALIENGGTVIDTWPEEEVADRAFGEVINSPGIRDKLFIATKIDVEGKQAGLDQFNRAQQSFQRYPIDLLQIMSLVDVESHWPTLQALKASGNIRYAGVTASRMNNHANMVKFISRETPDFVQINYSISERRAEEIILPMCQEKGIAVLINRPFMNGSYFERLRSKALPAWTSNFDCSSWAQFSLKYIIAHPTITSIFTETTSPIHMAENAMAAFGAIPDAEERQRMRDLIDSI